MKRFIAFVILLVLCFPSSVYAAKLPEGFWETTMVINYKKMPSPVASRDDKDVANIFFYFYDSIAKATFEDVTNYLKSMNYSYTGGIGNDYTLSQINISLKLGNIYMAFYPTDFSSKSTAFGDPKREYLSCVEYTRGDYSISASDSLHVDTTTYSVLNKKSDPPKHIVDDYFLVYYYNYEIGGAINSDEIKQKSASTSGSIAVTHSSDDLQSSLRSTATSRAKEYLEVKITDFSLRYDPDNNAFTQIQIRMTWNCKNGVEKTKEMLEMYSDDMAVVLHEKYPDIKISGLYMFWSVPYLVKNGVAAKYVYESRLTNMYRIGTYGPLYY